MLSMSVFISLVMGMIPLSRGLTQDCGTLSDASAHLLQHQAVFEAPEWAEERAGLGLNVLDPGDPVELVTDPATCELLVDKVMDDLGLAGAPDSETYAIYRYGDYYAVEVVRPEPAGETRYTGSDRLFVITVGQGTKLKGSIGV